MEIRVRDYRAEEAAHLLPREPTDDHPLITRSPAHKIDVADSGNSAFYDPLRGLPAKSEDDIVNMDTQGTMMALRSDKDSQSLAIEWVPFRRLLMQKFSVSKNVSVSSISDVIIKSGKASERSSTSLHLEEMDNSQKLSEDGVKVITQQEYASRLRELKSEIGQAWKSGDRVTSLKLSTKVARLLMDTSVAEFYPALFVLVSEILDMLGDMVWERIKRRAEYADDGTLICLLQDEFSASDVCPDAKETCYNWFCKIGSIRELLPRIYLELAILRCWRFLHEQVWGSLQRLLMMIRGFADPLASFYCRLYLVRCAQKFFPRDTGYLLPCIGDMNIILARIVTEDETTSTYSLENKKSLIRLLEPTIEWVVRCICKDSCKKEHLEDIFTKLQFGKELSNSLETSQCISIILHHFLKELPAEIICLRSSYIVQLLESTNDISMNQCLNFRVFGHKLSKEKPEAGFIDSVLGKVFQVVTQYSSLDEFVEVVDAFLDIVLQRDMDSYLVTFLNNISMKACGIAITENTQRCLQTIFIKLLSYFNDLEDAYALNHFAEIIHMMHGSSRVIVDMHILSKGTRNGLIHDPARIQMLFEISRDLHASMDILNINDDNHKQQARLISRFVQMVDYGAAVERHLIFLAECRGAFGRISELKEDFVHYSNSLAVKAIKRVNFVKSCIAYNEVTIPCISDSTKRMSLYLESVEVALLGGLLSHADGLVDSTIECLQNLEGSPLQQKDMDVVLSLIQKFCSLVVMLPGNPERGAAYIPKSLLSLVELSSWVTPQLRVRVFCSVLSLTATLSQQKLPYHACNTEIVSNEVLYYGDPIYKQEIAAISTCVFTNLIDAVLQEPHRVTRGRLALEACNWTLSSFTATEQIREMCWKLIEIGKPCLGVKDNYMRTTVCFLEKLYSGDSVAF